MTYTVGIHAPGSPPVDGCTALQPMLAVDQQFPYPGGQRWLRTGADTATSVVWELEHPGDYDTVVGRLSSFGASRFLPSRVSIGGADVAMVQTQTTSETLPLVVRAFDGIGSQTWIVNQTATEGQPVELRGPRRNLLRDGASVVTVPAGVISPFFDEVDFANNDPAAFNQWYRDHPLGREGLHFRSAHATVEPQLLAGLYVADFLDRHGVADGLARLTSEAWTAWVHNNTVLCAVPGEAGLCVAHLQHDRARQRRPNVMVRDDAGNLLFHSQMARDVWIAAWGPGISRAPIPTGRHLFMHKGMEQRAPTAASADPRRFHGSGLTK